MLTHFPRSTNSLWSILRSTSPRYPALRRLLASLALSRMASFSTLQSSFKAVSPGGGALMAPARLGMQARSVESSRKSSVEKVLASCGAGRGSGNLVCGSVAEGAAPSSGSVTETRTKKTCIVTGSSSGLGLYTAKALAAAGWHVIMACRDWAKAETAAKSVGIPSSSFTVMHLDLASLNSVRNFVKIFRASDTPLDALVCNAAVYLPQAKQPTFTADGFELSVGTNHLGHFLLVNLMIEDLKKSVAAGRAPRCVMVGSVTGNTNTLAGSIPPRADLGDLSGLARGLSGGHPMIDDKEFDGAKAYKDSKVCNMLTMRELNDRFGKDGIVFSSLYPGCIAETPLFRNHNSFFRWSFPILQKNLTKGYVSQETAGERLASLVKDPSFTEPGAYWSWKVGGDDLYDNFNASDTDGAYVNEPSEEVTDKKKAEKMWELSAKLVGL